LRTYHSNAANLLKLPNNPAGAKPVNPNEKSKFNGVCPKSAPVRSYTVVADTASDLLPGGTLVYNSRSGSNNDGPLHDPTAILYVLKSDIDSGTGKLYSYAPVEPLVLRANAGDCIVVSLENRLPNTVPDLDGFATLPTIVDRFNANQVRPSSRVGLHAQLVQYDVTRSDGNDAGKNKLETIGPGKSGTYQWYAGDLSIQNDGTILTTPIEFGATNLIPADRVKQPGKGAIGSLIIEPKGSSWTTDAGTRSSATVTKADSSEFREFVLHFQNFVNLRFGDGSPIPIVARNEDPEDSGHKAFNYKTEPFWFRFGYAPDATLQQIRARNDLWKAVSNNLVGGDPETPVFTANAGEDVRFRVLHPGGNQRNNVFTVHGHVWQQEPWINGSTEIGENKDFAGFWRTMFEGSHMGVGPTGHFNAVLQNGAGGAFGVSGDYLYRDFASFQFDGGLWGILRVLP
jgi:hypothetical protein